MQGAGAHRVKRAVGLRQRVEALTLHGIAQRVDVVLLKDARDPALGVANDPALAVLRGRRVEGGQQGQVRLAAACPVGGEELAENGFGDDAVPHGDDQQRVAFNEAGHAQRLICGPRRAAGRIGGLHIDVVSAQPRHDLFAGVAHQSDARGRAHAPERVDRVPRQRRAPHRLDALWRGAEARALAGRQQHQNARGGAGAAER